MATSISETSAKASSAGTQFMDVEKQVSKFKGQISSLEGKLESALEQAAKGDTAAGLEAQKLQSKLDRVIGLATKIIESAGKNMQSIINNIGRG